MPAKPAKPKNMIIEVFLALLAGFILGMIFCAIKLPLPAPPALAGVMGIVGIFLGGATWKLISERVLQ